MPHYLKAIERDPTSARLCGHRGSVLEPRRRDEADKNYRLAMAKIDRMSDREKFRTRGGYYLIVRRDPDKAIEEYSQLVSRYPADTAGIANLALAYFYKRDMGRALAEGRRAIKVYPKNVPQRNNVGLYAMYAGDFDTAIKEQSEVLAMNPRFVLAYVGLALSQLAQGHADLATDTCKKAMAVDARGASDAALGLADITLSQGKPADALPLLGKGIEADLAAQDQAPRPSRSPHSPARNSSLGRRRPSLRRRIGPSPLDGRKRALPCGGVYLLAGRKRSASPSPRSSTRLEQDPQAYAALIRGEAELPGGRPREAIKTLETPARSPTRMGHFLLGRASPRPAPPRRRPGARDLREAARRGDRALPRRGSDVAPLPAGRLLPCPREGRTQEPRGCRRLQGVLATRPDDSPTRWPSTRASASARQSRSRNRRSGSDPRGRGLSRRPRRVSCGRSLRNDDDPNVPRGRRRPAPPGRIVPQPNVAA